MLQVDFSEGPGPVGSDVNIMVPPGHVDNVTTQLRNAGMTSRLVTRNVQELVTFSYSFSIIRFTYVFKNTTHKIENDNTLNQTKILQHIYYLIT